MLKSVRCSGVRVRVFRWHWLSALVAAMIIVACGPTRRSDAKSTAYDTDIVELLVRSGSWTLSVAVADDRIRSTANRIG
jgi:hypothetical protein